MSTSPLPSTAEPTIASLEAFDELIAAVADLQEATEMELRERHEWLTRELVRVEAELAELTEPAELVKPAEPMSTAEPVGKPKTAKKARTVAAGTAKKVTLKELLADLEAAPNHTLNIRKAHLDVKGVKALAKANSHLLQLGGKGAWPTVTLMKLPGEPAPGARKAGSPQGIFSFGEGSSEVENRERT